MLNMGLKILILSLLTIQAFAQNKTTTYYKFNGETVDNKEQAQIFIKTKQTKKGFISDRFIKTEEGWIQGFHENVKIKNDSVLKIGRYKNGEFYDPITRIYSLNSDSLYLIKDYIFN